MICERQTQIDVRRLGRDLPRGMWIMSQWVRITTTPCHFGGVRYWFQCPRCDRRCAILYPQVCRICGDGRYEVELLIPAHRKITKAIRLRRRLGQTSGGIVAQFPKKPKWMRWHTYLNLRAKSEKYEKQLWVGEGARLDRLQNSQR
jgi:hypothetical protein